jgi:exonuclease SbcC
MIESLRLRNFQPHSDRTIEFDKYVTTIVGPTDRGKSAILRALRWICFNRPAGDDFLQFGRKFVSVILKIDGHKIRRRRGDKNLYELDGAPFVAFGTNVPPEIAQLLNVGETNFQGQGDGPFWLGESPATAAKKLNAVVDLSIIDRSLGAIATTVRREKTAVDLTRERLTAAKQRLETLAWVPEFDAELGELEGRAAKLRARRAQIDAMTAAAARLRNAIQLKRDAAPAVQDGRAVLQLGATAARLKNELREMTSALQRIQGLTKSWENTKRALANAAAELKKRQPEYCPTCGRPM